jgi:hypothetical protein
MDRRTILTFVLSATILLGGCDEEGPRDLEVTATVDGSTVMFEWSGTLANVVDVRRDGESVSTWAVGDYDPDRDPFISPPLEYGADRDDVLTGEPVTPLERGQTYRVEVEVHGKGEACQELGIDGETCKTHLGAATFVF